MRLCAAARAWTSHNAGTVSPQNLGDISCMYQITVEFLLLHHPEHPCSKYKCHHSGSQTQITAFLFCCSRTEGLRSTGIQLTGTGMALRLRVWGSLTNINTKNCLLLCLVLQYFQLTVFCFVFFQRSKFESYFLSTLKMNFTNLEVVWLRWGD